MLCTSCRRQWISSDTAVVLYSGSSFRNGLRFPNRSQRNASLRRLLVKQAPRKAFTRRLLVRPKPRLYSEFLKSGVWGRRL